VLLSSVFLLVWMSWVRKIILGSVLAGIALQFAGYYAPPEYAGSVIIAGIGLVCAAGAGLVGKEAYCFAYREGWALMWLYAVMVLANLMGREYRIFNALGFSAAFLLLLSLTGKKLKQPLTSCGRTSRNRKKTPEQKSRGRTLAMISVLLKPAPRSRKETGAAE
jgi:uncharacterized integral membrane protein